MFEIWSVFQTQIPGPYRAGMIEKDFINVVTAQTALLFVCGCMVAVCGCMVAICDCISCGSDRWLLVLFLSPREENDAWVLEGKPLDAHTDWVRDVAWCPSVGLPLSRIASCSQVRC